MNQKDIIFFIDKYLGKQEKAITTKNEKADQELENSNQLFVKNFRKDIQSNIHFASIFATYKQPLETKEDIRRFFESNYQQLFAVSLETDLKN
jgi:hypothetical protein